MTIKNIIKLSASAAILTTLISSPLASTVNAETTSSKETISKNNISPIVNHDNNKLRQIAVNNNLNLAIVPTTNVMGKSSNISDQAWSNKLAKAGYIFKLSKDIYASSGGLFPSNFAKRQPYSVKYAKKIYDKKMLFKIDQFKSVKNGTSIHIVSKNKKYQFWTNFLTGTCNIYGRRKALKPIIKAEIKVIRTTDKKTASRLLAKATKVTAKLHGSNKKIASDSIIQLKQWLNNKNFVNIPVLLIGSL